MTFAIVLGIVFAIGLPVVAVAARRFERRRRAEGEWDEQGPLHPTRPPPNVRGTRFGNGLAYDLQHGLDRDEDWPGGRKPGKPEPPTG